MRSPRAGMDLWLGSWWLTGPSSNLNAVWLQACPNPGGRAPDLPGPRPGQLLPGTTAQAVAIPRVSHAEPAPVPAGRHSGEPSVRRLGVHDGAEEVEVRVDLDGQTRVH